MPISRRLFIKGAITSGLIIPHLEFPALAASAIEQDELFLVANGSGEFEIEKISQTKPGEILGWNPQTDEVFSIKCPFFGHIPVVNKLNHKFFAVEKWGRKGGFFDLKDRVMLAELQPEEGYRFFGHGFFTKTAAEFVTTENILEKKLGCLVVRDSSTYKVLDVIEIKNGQYPHDVLYLPEKNQAVVSANNDPDKKLESRLIYIDLKTKKIVNEKLVEKKLQAKVTHMKYVDGRILTGDKVYGSEAAPSFFITWDQKGALKVFEIPKEDKSSYIGEILSIAVHQQSKTVAVTVPYGRSVFLWNFETQTFIKKIPLDVPMGVEFTNDYLIVNERGSQKLLLFSIKDNFVRTKQMKWGNGSHIAKASLPKRASV